MVFEAAENVTMWIYTSTLQYNSILVEITIFIMQREFGMMAESILHYPATVPFLQIEEFVKFHDLNICLQ
jgi:hypothetical protein